MRARIGYRAWRGLHWLAYASWPLAVAHSLGTGSDARFGWMAALGFGCTAAVALAVLLRTYYSRGTARLRVGAGAAALLAPLLLLVWYQGGPSQPGWAARAGTPAAILGRHAVRVSMRTTPQRPPGLPAVFNGRLTGLLKQSSPDASGYVAVRIGALIRGGIRGKLRLVLRGIPLGAEGVSLASSGVAFAAAGSPAVYEGSITGLQGTVVLAHLSAPSAGSVELRLSLSIDSQSGPRDRACSRRLVEGRTVSSGAALASSGLGTVPRLLAGLRSSGPVPLADHLRRGGSILEALPARPQDLIGAIAESGLAGRGGAGFPAGLKLGAVAERRKRPGSL